MFTNHVQHLNSHAYSAKKHYSTTLKQTFETSWSIQQQSFVKHHPSPACRILVAATMQPCGSKIIRFESYLAATHASSHYWTLLQQCHRKATMRKVQSWRRMGCWKMSWKILERCMVYLPSIHPMEAEREMMCSQVFWQNFWHIPRYNPMYPICVNYFSQGAVINMLAHFLFYTKPSSQSW